MNFKNEFNGSLEKAVKLTIQHMKRTMKIKGKIDTFNYVRNKNNNIEVFVLFKRESYHKEYIIEIFPFITYNLECIEYSVYDF